MHLQKVIRTACRTAALLGNFLNLAVLSQELEVLVLAAAQDPALEDQLVQEARVARTARAEAQAAQADQAVVQVAMADQEEATEARVVMAAEAVVVAANLNIS